MHLRRLEWPDWEAGYETLIFPLCATLLIVAGVIEAVPTSSQQHSTATPLAAFEVASIKIAREPEVGPFFCLIPCTPGERLTVDGSLVDIRYFSIYRLIVTAYGLKVSDLSASNPNTVSQTYWDWMNSQRFDISAKIPDGVSKDKVPEMLRALLAERFELAFHREMRDLPVYGMVVGKDGPKLKPAAADAETAVSDDLASTAYTPQGDARVEKMGYAITTGPFGPIRSYVDPNRTIHTELLKVTMAKLVEVLPIRDRPIVDMTNLKGFYQFSWERLAASPGELPNDIGVTVREALGKAGLKLEPRMAPLEVIVIDHLEKTPTPN